MWESPTSHLASNDGTRERYPKYSAPNCSPQTLINYSEGVISFFLFTEKACWEPLYLSELPYGAALVLSTLYSTWHKCYRCLVQYIQRACSPAPLPLWYIRFSPVIHWVGRVGWPGSAQIQCFLPTASINYFPVVYVWFSWQPVTACTALWIEFLFILVTVVNPSGKEAKYSALSLAEFLKRENKTCLGNIITASSAAALFKDQSVFPLGNSWIYKIYISHVPGLILGV